MLNGLILVSLGVAIFGTIGNIVWMLRHWARVNPEGEGDSSTRRKIKA